MAVVPIARHYRVREIADGLRLSRRTVVRLFRDEPGVLQLTQGRRATLIIPEAVYNRVCQRFSKGQAGDVPAVPGGGPVATLRGVTKQLRVG